MKHYKDTYRHYKDPWYTMHITGVKLGGVMTSTCKGVSRFLTKEELARWFYPVDLCGNHATFDFVVAVVDLISNEVTQLHVTAETELKAALIAMESVDPKCAVSLPEFTYKHKLGDLRESLEEVYLVNVLKV